MTNPTDREDVRAGRFWLPDQSENAVSGRLTLPEAARCRLELDEALTPLLREVDGGQQPSGARTLVLKESGPGREHLVVHGVLEDGALVTLVDAVESRRETGHGQDRQWLRAWSAVLGGHVSGGDEVYTRMRLRLRHIDSWAGPGAPSPVSLGSGGWLDLEQERQSGVSEIEGGPVGRAAWLRLVDLPPLTVEELDRCFATPLASLVTLAADTDCPPVAVEVATAPDEPWLTLHHSGLQASSEETWPWYRQLLPLPLLGLERVATWLNAVEQLGPLPPVIARAAAGSGGTLETQLLELTTVAEGLHRRLFPESRRLSEEHASAARAAVNAATSDLNEEVRAGVNAAMQHIAEPSFPRRLMELARCAESAVPGVTGQTNRWKGCVTEVRNEFAHRIKGFLQTARIDELVAVRESLRWLLTGLLLLQTGLPPAELAGRLGDHQRYALFLLQARDRLPRIFDA